ncbi:MAG: response regulator transcription factor [Anaerolineales bacterium]|jgi:DNA-binding NarL/FixJ family response regulator
MTPIRIALVDDQALFREGLRTILSLQPDLEIVGEAADGREAIALIHRTNPDVVLMDLKMPSLDGVEATRLIKGEHPSARILILTTFDDDEYVFEGLRAGAVGYLLKDAPSDKLIEAIRAAARGESFLQPSVAAKVVAEFSRLADRPSDPSNALVEPLSERELEVLRLLAHGSTNRKIAETLVIAEGTVKNHVTSILGKLGVDDRTQAAIKAKDLGLF